MNLNYCPQCTFTNSLKNCEYSKQIKLLFSKLAIAKDRLQNFGLNIKMKEINVVEMNAPLYQCREK